MSRKFFLTDAVAQKMSDSACLTKAAVREQTVPDEVEKDEDTSEFSAPVRIVWRTDVGKVRKINQDSVIIGNGLAGVADGMGGHNGGEIASAGLRDGLLRETEGKTPGTECLREAIEKINLELWNIQEQDASLTGMGTTLTVLWPAQSEMIIAQVGDSRAYLLRDGILRQVTSDHSMVADMVRRGIISEDQAASHPMRNFITRAVGTEDTIEADITIVARQAGDRWLVCSDGLYSQMSKKELSDAMMLDNPEEAANLLLETALDHGGRDNISLLIVVEGSDEKSDPPADEAPGKEAADHG